MSSNYPNGFANGVTIRGVPLLQTHPGEVFWVNNSSVLAKGGVGGSDGNDGSYRRPFSTLDYAIGKCTASRGDIIAVMPGHAETIATDGGVTLDKAGVAVVGLGVGSLRPTFTMSVVASAVVISAANVSISNLKFVTGVDVSTNCIDITAANAAIENCHFSESAGDMCWLDVISATGGTDNDCDGLRVTDCVYTSIDDSANNFIALTSDVDEMFIADNFVCMTHANALKLIDVATGKTMTNMQIHRNILDQRARTDTSGEGSIIGGSTATDNTGVMTHNLISNVDTAGQVIEDATGINKHENYVTGAITVQGVLYPVAETVD